MLFILLLQTTIGIAQSVLPLPNGAANVSGQIEAAALQADGKLVVGGNFSAIDGIARQNIARLNADSSVDLTWNPGCDGTVLVLAVSGTTIYAGGYFGNIGGQSRSNIGALDWATGLATSWNPGADNGVWTLAVSGSTVYAGGYFANAGGQPRNNVAAIDSTSGLATSWNPNADSSVRALAISSNTIFVAGNFANIGGQPRANIAAIDSTSGLATSWNPNADGIIVALATAGSNLYVGGYFSHVGGQPRVGIGAIDETSGLATTWNPGSEGGLNTLAVSGGTVYVGGNFGNMGGQARKNIAAVDATTGLATAWNPGADRHVDTFVISGNKIYVGGVFLTVGGQPVGGLAVIDATSGAVAPAPQISQPVNVTSIQTQNDGKTIIGGAFTAINGISRANIARLNIDGNVDTTWNPNANNTVNAIAISDGVVYVGGFFDQVGGQSRVNIAALDATTALATSWNPSGDFGGVSALAVSGGVVYAGGGFQSIGGQPRNRIAAIDVSDGLVTAWNPNADSQVSSIAVSGSVIYAGGFFSNIGGQSRNSIAALDSNSGLATPWNPAAINFVKSMFLAGNTVYAAGQFVNIGGQSRIYIGAVDTATGLATAWNPGADNFVEAIAPAGNTIYAGGNFGHIGGSALSNAAAIDVNSGLASPWNAGLAGGNVNAVAVSATRNSVYLAGNFTTVNGRPHAGIVALTQLDEIFYGGFLPLPTGASECTYSISPTEYSLTSLAGSGLVTVASPQNCAWSATSNTNWISVTSGSSGVGSGSVGYSVSANAGPTERIGSITIAGLPFVVTQEATACAAISPTNTSVPSAGSSQSVVVTAGNDCNWTATSNAAWITVTSGGIGVGNGTVYFTVTPNNSTQSRSGTITIAGSTFSVTQDGVVCVFSLSPTMNAVPSTGGSGYSVAVNAPSGCNWTALSNADWIAVTSDAIGNGSGTVSYSVDPNPTTDLLTGTITIAGQTFTVNQDGTGCSFQISPTNDEVVSAGGSDFTVDVTAPSGCAWTAASSNDWITITSGGAGVGDGVVTYSVAPNPTLALRNGTIVVAFQDFAVTQDALYAIFVGSINGSGSFTYLSGNSICTMSIATNGVLLTLVVHTYDAATGAVTGAGFNTGAINADQICPLSSGSGKFTPDIYNIISGTTGNVTYVNDFVGGLLINFKGSYNGSEIVGTATFTLDSSWAEASGSVAVPVVLHISASLP